MDHLLRNAIILDTETTSLRRGAGIHEVAIYDLEKMLAKEWILEPNYIRVTNTTPQDVAKFSTSHRDIHTSVKVNKWSDAIIAELQDQVGPSANRGNLLETLKWRNKFLYDAIKSGKYPHLLDKIENNVARDKALTNFGINTVLHERTTAEDFFGSTLKKEIAGKTVWIANAPFESKQIGSQIAAMEAAGIKVDIKSVLETYSQSNPDPFYVTGKEVNKARVLAQITGDWRGVWKAYAETPIPKGATAVRDIQDVLRSIISYGRSMNMLSEGSHYFGTGIDTAHSFMARASKDLSRIGLQESHRALEDAALHESYVLGKSLSWAQVLSRMDENPAFSREMQEKAARGNGLFHEIRRYFALLEGNKDTLMRANLVKRFERAYEDLSTHGVTYHTTGGINIVNMEQEVFQGGKTSVSRASHLFKGIRTLEDFKTFIMPQYAGYNIDVEAEYAAFKQRARNLPEALSYAAERNKEILSKLNYDILEPRGLLGKVSSTGLADDIINVFSKAQPKTLAYAAAGVAAFGFLLGSGKPKPREEASLLGYGYEDWLESQEGHATQGVMADQRKQNTDFGSPYRGPVVSSQVLENQELLRERERWIRQQYHASYYDPWNGILNSINTFGLRNWKTMARPDEEIANGYQGFRGDNLKGINLKNYNVFVEDADTVRIRKKGFAASLAAFVGYGDDYTFRLAGIDAPETAHGGRAAQPYAEEAKAALQTMIDQGKNLELVFNPNDMTYGRMMGGLAIDGQNINYEMVKRGYVAHLSYGMQADAIVDYSSMKKYENTAYKANRGLWSTAWGKVIFAGSSPGERPTFNTLANPAKAASSAYEMSLAASAKAANESNVLDIMNEIKGIPKSNGADPIHRFPYYDYTSQNMAVPVNEVQSSSMNPSYNERSTYKSSSPALDMRGTNTSPWSRRRPQAFNDYEIKRRRVQLLEMAAAQQTAARQIFQSNIGHYRMQ